MNKVVVAARMAKINESATLALNARAKQMAAEGKKIYNLTAGELALETPDYIQMAVAGKLHLNKYTPVAGLPELRHKIAAEARAFYHKDWIEAANVVVTAGAKPALYSGLLSIINPGDEVVVLMPAWVSYQHLIELAGGIMIPVSLSENFDLDVPAIAAKISSRTKAVIINSPHNPTGSIFSAMALGQLARLLRGTAVTVIADDIYAKLVYEDTFIPVSSFDFEHILIINGFSKSQALTGWRIGYLIAHTDIVMAATSILSHTMGNAALPSQQAALAALDAHDIPLGLPGLKKQRHIADEYLKAVPKIKYQLPGGAFYIYIDLRSITADSADWCERLLINKGVALVPGEAFGTPGFARLSFVTDERTLKKALELIAQFVGENKKP